MAKPTIAQCRSIKDFDTPDLEWFDRQFSPDRPGPWLDLADVYGEEVMLTDEDFWKQVETRREGWRQYVRSRNYEVKVLRRIWLEQRQVYDPNDGFGQF